MLGNNWAILDPIAAIVVCILIIVTAFKIIRQASGELLEESLPKDIEDRIEQIAYQDPLVSDIHKLHTRRIGNIIAIEMHLRMPSDVTLAESHIHANSIEKSLKHEFGNGTHIMLHIEPKK